MLAIWLNVDRSISHNMRKFSVSNVVHRPHMSCMKRSYILRKTGWIFIDASVLFYMKFCGKKMETGNTQLLRHINDVMM